MSIGFGITLAAIIISLTLLYINKREDIELPKLLSLRKFVFIILSVTLAILAAYFLYIWIFNMPKKQNSYESIKLGMSMKEVQYIKGQPKYIIKEKLPLTDYRPTEDPNKLDEKNNIFNYPNWVFDIDGKYINTDFDKPNGKIVAISCSIPPTQKYSDKGGAGCDPLSGITIGTSEDALKKRLGAPDDEKFSENKEIIFKKFNATFILSKQKVFYIQFKDPEWVDGSNLTIIKDGSNPLTSKPFDSDSYLRKIENNHKD